MIKHNILYTIKIDNRYIRFIDSDGVALTDDINKAIIGHFEAIDFLAAYLDASFYDLDLQLVEFACK